jgi:co-chaperonin GroES (HSP10)
MVKEVKTAPIDEVMGTWQMLHDFVLIEDFGSPETFYDGSIILLSGMKRNFPIRFGKVLLTGPGRILYSKTKKRRYREKMDVKPGDIVMFWKLHGAHTCYESEDGFVLRVLDNRNQIPAVVTEPPNHMASMEEFEDWLREKSHPGWKMSP